MDCNLLFLWLMYLHIDDLIRDATVFTNIRERLMRGEVSERPLVAVVERALEKDLLCEEHFTVDGHADTGVGGAQQLQAEGVSAKAAAGLPSSNKTASSRSKSSRCKGLVLRAAYDGSTSGRMISSFGGYTAASSSSATTVLWLAHKATNTPIRIRTEPM